MLKYILFILCLSMAESSYDDAKRFLRVLKLVKNSKNNKFNSDKIIKNCDVWEALRLYSKNKSDFELNDQSRIILEQIRKKANLLDYSDSRVEIIDNVSNLAIRQMEVLDLIDREKGILESTAATIDGILEKIMSIYNITFNEHINDYDNDYVNKKYSLISDKPYELSFKHSSLSEYGNDLNYKYSINNKNKKIINWKMIFKRNNSIKHNDNVINEKVFNEKKVINEKATNEKTINEKAINEKNKNQLYELIESLMYGSGRLRLLQGAFEMIEEDAQGVFSRLSWDLNDKLNKINTKKDTNFIY